MKYLFSILASIVLLSGCFHESVDDSNMSIYEFTYNGHSYIEFKSLNSYGSTVIHSPNCYCYDKHM